ncbi:MAG: hypothetical protein WCR97_05480 [Bacilli bacterium]
MEIFLRVLFSIIVFLVLFILFIVLYKINKKTKVPKGARELERDEFSCSHCGHSECKFFISKKKEDK